MKRLRSSDDVESYNDKNVDGGESLNSDRPTSSSSHRWGRRGPISPSRYDRDRDRQSGDDALGPGFSRSLSRRRSSRDLDDNRRNEQPDVRYSREERLHRSESAACFSRRAFPKGFRSERERPTREASVSSSWRRFGGDFGRERGGLGLRLRDGGERERTSVVKSPSRSRDEQSKLKLDSRNSRSRSKSKSLASPTWSKDSGSEQSKSVGNVVKKSDEEVQGKSSRSSSEMEEGELEPEPQPQPETASGAAQPVDHKDERIDSSFQETEKNADFDDNLTTVETESSNREACHLVGDRKLKMAESRIDKKSVEKGEIVPEHATESTPASQNNVNDTSTALSSEHELRDERNTAVVEEITDMIDDKGDKEGEYKENHEVKLEESPDLAVPERFQAEELNQVKGSDGGDANKGEVEAPKCIEENALGNRSSPARYISIVSDSSNHKCEDKGKNLDAPLTHLLGNAVFSERKPEDLTDIDKDEDGNIGGPSIRGFELFSSAPVRKTNKTEHLGVNKPKDEKLLLEPLDLSLSLPDVLLPIGGGQDTNHPPGSPVRSESVRSMTDTFRTDSEGFTMSMSFSGSRSFNHNPSCSLNHNIGDNEQSVHSRPIFQGIDWQALSHNDSRYNENTVYQKLMENGNGSVHPQSRKGILIPGQADEEPLRLTDGSSKAPNRLEKQLSFQRSVDVSRSACPRTGSLENDSKFHVEKKKAKDFFGGSISGVDAGGDESVETVIRYILSDSMHVMTKRFHEMPTRYITSLKENIRQMMLHMDKNSQLGAFQDALQNRTDITLDLLTKSHRAQLEILVALKTGRSDFLELDNSVSSTHLAEIYMNIRCKNLSCRVLVPVDECDCRVCSRKDGFCSACMCLLCSNFDMASNTCSWVGCDVCLHWCHTECGIRESYIRNGINASGATGMTEMQFHCVACNHPSEMFGFVKEVFLNFAREWKHERFCKELEYVIKIFSSSKDFRGKQLRQAADAMLASLKSKLIDLPEACNRILGFISDCDSSTPVETCAPLRYEQPKPRHERGSPSQDTAWLRSVCSDKPHHQLKRSASVVDGFQRERQGEIFGVETGLKRESPKEPRFEELESIVRMKQAEAAMFQGRADDARREAEGLKRIAIAKKEKIEEEYKRRMGKLSVEEAEERRRRRLEELEAMERGQREFYEMKMRMEEEMRGLLNKMEVTKQSLAL
uniref:Protein OBERON 4 n=1 Tax=Noccaea caerulescens TaxID=107243 RepID=A0A1J3EK27_NOCCA